MRITGAVSARACVALKAVMLRLLALLMTVATACGPYHRRPQLDPMPLPIDLVYFADGRTIHLEIDAYRVVSYCAHGHALYAKVPQAKIDELSAHLENPAFREFLRESRHSSVARGATLTLYARGWGVACFNDGQGGWTHRTIRGYPPYVVSVDRRSIAPAVSTLVEVVNDIGHTALPEKFIPIEISP
jgi:hypothetical protein